MTIIKIFFLCLFKTYSKLEGIGVIVIICTTPFVPAIKETENSLQWLQQATGVLRPLILAWLADVSSRDLIIAVLYEALYRYILIREGITPNVYNSWLKVVVGGRGNGKGYSRLSSSCCQNRQHNLAAHQLAPPFSGYIVMVMLLPRCCVKSWGTSEDWNVLTRSPPTLHPTSEACFLE